MSRVLRILHGERDRVVLALTIRLGDDGLVTFERGPDDPGAAQFVESLVRPGVDVPSATETDPAGAEFRLVEPTAGAAYLDAVVDMLGRTSRWIVVPE